MCRRFSHAPVRFVCNALHADEERKRQIMARKAGSSAPFAFVYENPPEEEGDGEGDGGAGAGSGSGEQKRGGDDSDGEMVRIFPQRSRHRDLNVTLFAAG